MGVAGFEQVSGVLSQLFDAVNRVTQLIESISTATNEQAQGIEQINIAITQLDHVTQANAASSEEAASSSEQLSGQAADLAGVVERLGAMAGRGAGRSAREIEHAGNGRQPNAAAPLPGNGGIPAPISEATPQIMASGEVLSLEDDSREDDFES
jgi:methyl-accepting chemotaxis protein